MVHTSAVTQTELLRCPGDITDSRPIPHRGKQGMKYTETGGTLKSLPPADANLALHVQRAHLQMLSWKVAEKSDPPDVQLTDYGWEVKEHERVMPAISRERAAPSKLMDVVRCSCKAEGKVCSGRCSYGSNGMSCTSYCVCEGGMLAVTHLLNRRRTKSTHNRVKWILMNLGEDSD